MAGREESAPGLQAVRLPQNWAWLEQGAGVRFLPPAARPDPGEGAPGLAAKALNAATNSLR